MLSFSPISRSGYHVIARGKQLPLSDIGICHSSTFIAPKKWNKSDAFTDYKALVAVILNGQITALIFDYWAEM